MGEIIEMNKLGYIRYHELEKNIIEKYNLFDINSLRNINLDNDTYHKYQIYEDGKIYNKLESKRGPKTSEKNIKYSNSYKLIIQRSDYTYTKCKNFKPYEITTNFAYEFAKRRHYNYRFEEDKFHIYLIFLYILNQTYDYSYDNHKTDVYDLIASNLEKDLYYDAINNFILHNSDSYIAVLEKINVKHIVTKNLDFKFIQPMFNVPWLLESMDSTFDIRINLSLPEDEIIEYIKYLKKEHSNNLDNLKLFHSTRKSYIDVLSDMLFIYDCRRFDIAYTHILPLIEEYYFDRDKKKTSVNEDTANKYYDYAKLLIEEEYYKMLISNHTLSELNKFDIEELEKLENDQNTEVIYDKEEKYFFFKKGINKNVSKINTLKNSISKKNMNLKERKLEIDAKYSSKKAKGS